MQPTTYASVTRSDVTCTEAGRAAPGRADVGLRHNVLVVDDHPLYRAGLMWALAALPLRFREAGTSMAAIDALACERFDLILYDWHLPDGGGCRGLAAITRLAARVPVIVISAGDDETIDVAAGCMGAADRITKADDAVRIRAVVSRVLGCTDDPTAEVAAEFERNMPVSTVELTQRQRDVLGQMASGQPNKRIATALGIADSTVRAHVSEILRLMHARNRTEAVVRAHRERLLPYGHGSGGDADTRSGAASRAFDRLDSARARRSSCSPRRDQRSAM